ncbi:methyltransferase [Synechococcus elongatus]|uniref:Methyltransferase n=1 Tax=Synechococcus elongatus PCC 11802 TaxID=2283154 RepID=A0AAT9JML6_SYNEL|nr:methyltransferase [Synechococcus elongatus]QFZ92430.1 methyltransferase domain-containing protein [Synechococcus elongatus PCC 11802]
MTQTAPILWEDLAFDTLDAEVYAPKPASLLLAEQAIAQSQPGDRILDACTGSGVVGIAIARYVPGSRVVVSDINEAALGAARRNAARNQVAIEVVASNLYSAFDEAQFDTITVHPPAVPYPNDADWGLSSGMTIATNGGSDGSELVIRSIVEAKSRIRPGGKLLLLLPHWSNVAKARQALTENYSNVRELARQTVEFFPVREGRTDAHLLAHVRQLAAAGIIEMTFETEIPLSIVSVIEATVD